MDIVLKLRELRRLSGLSQKEVADSSGVGEKTLSTFESGTRIASMKVLQLFAILSVYGTTPAEFFGGKIEADVFGELERLAPPELALIRELRLLDPALRTRLEEKFSDMIEAAEVLLSTCASAHSSVIPCSLPSAELGKSSVCGPALLRGHP